MSFIKIYLNRYRFLLRYGISGALAGALQTFILFVWVSVLELADHYLWGLVVGFCITLCFSFTLQRFWTFGEREHHHRSHHQFVLYGLTALGSLALNALLLFLSKQIFESFGFNFFELWYLVAQVVIIGIVAVLSFLINYTFTFKEIKKHTLV